MLLVRLVRTLGHPLVLCTTILEIGELVDFRLAFPEPTGETREIPVSSGKMLFLVGANGSGKSTLMQNFATQNRGNVRRITAHRQVWFPSNVIDLTPATRESHEKNITQQDSQPQARWRDDYAAQRSQVTIFDLIDSENVDARRIAAAARSGDLEQVATLAKAQAPISMLNEILKTSNLQIQIEVDQGSKLFATRDGYAPYSIAELSDGERNALIVIANVLTAPESTLILIDEPERHLHRSIVSPLLSTLLSYRNDCALVISTHDVSLPIDQVEASALLARSYTHAPQAWDIDFIEAVEELDEQVAVSVLGARRQILFIEGEASSLDLQLYQILFPELSIKTAGSCIDVERIVRGVRSSDQIHWVSAHGVIDRDNRGQEECDRLNALGIVTLEHYSVESIYYHPTTMTLIAQRVSALSGENADDLLEAAQDQVFEAVTTHADRLCARLIERRVRDDILGQVPSWRNILAGVVGIESSAASLLQDEKDYLTAQIAGRNAARLVTRYPLRETNALGGIATALGFQSRAKYEAAVRTMAVDDEDSRTALLGLLAPIQDALVRR